MTPNHGRQPHGSTWRLSDSDSESWAVLLIQWLVHVIRRGTPQELAVTLVLLLMVCAETVVAPALFKAT